MFITSNNTSKEFQCSFVIRTVLNYFRVLRLSRFDLRISGVLKHYAYWYLKKKSQIFAKYRQFCGEG